MTVKSVSGATTGCRIPRLYCAAISVASLCSAYGVTELGGKLIPAEGPTSWQMHGLFKRNISAIGSTVSQDKDTTTVFVHCDNSCCRE